MCTLDREVCIKCSNKVDFKNRVYKLPNTLFLLPQIGKSDITCIHTTCFYKNKMEVISTFSEKFSQN